MYESMATIEDIRVEQEALKEFLEIFDKSEAVYDEVNDYLIKVDISEELFRDLPSIKELNKHVLAHASSRFRDEVVTCYCNYSFEDEDVCLDFHLWVVEV